MKSFKITVSLLLIASLFIAGCSNQLDVKPKDQISRSQLSVNDIDKLKIGLYSLMENHLAAFLLDFDIRGENFQAGPAFALIDPVNMSPSDGGVNSLWNNAYSTLARVNFLIETIDALPGESASIHQKTKGEALTFRAMIYYNLVTRWGGVPVLTRQTYEIVPRADENQVWEQIESDLLKAESLMGEFTDRFYLSKQSAQALLARIYLAKGDYSKAVTYANLVIGNGKFNLAKTSQDYASLWVTNSKVNEHIFALANNNTRGSQLLYQNVNDVDGSWPYGPSAWVYQNLFKDDGFKSGDKRASAVFSGSIANRIIKYPNGVNGQQLVATSNPNHTPIAVIRLSEVYLIKAEAEGAQSGATTLAPYFEARYAVPPATLDIASWSATSFQNLILDERRREFYAEGYRWYDIKRTGRKDLLLSLNGRDYLLYYPIPQNQVDLAGYEQNKGY